MCRVTIFLAFLCFAFAKAQNESANWFFGVNAGIDFNQNPPQPRLDGALNTGEGCASISDENGNLLFYTDGRRIFNRNHVIMANGTGLLGNSSSTSSAIIVPQPNSNGNRYFVFTVDTDDGFFRNSVGLHYSVVDMALDGGNGGVVSGEKNINLLPLTSEKLTAVQNAVRDGFWIITQFEDTFYAYSLTASGLNTVPVTTVIAPFIELVDPSSYSNIDVVAMRGYLKCSPDGTKIAAAHYSNNTGIDFSVFQTMLEAQIEAYSNRGALYVYDFDNATGTVSNPVDLLDQDQMASPYGVEFSPDSQLLYAEVDYLDPNSSNFNDIQRGEVLQYDLTASDIRSTQQVIYAEDDPTSLFRGALQLAIDQKIYHTRLSTTALSVIHDPNQLGTGADYRPLDFDLNGRFAQWGLPLFIQSDLVSVDILIDDHCFGNEVGATYTFNGTALSQEWNFGDPASGAANTSTLPDPTHTFSAPGTYTVTLDVTTPNGIITTTETVTVFEDISFNNPPPDLTFCDEGRNEVTVDLTSIALDIDAGAAIVFAFDFYDSLSDAQNESNPLTLGPYVVSGPSEEIWVRVENADGCFAIESFTVTVAPDVEFIEPQDLTLCDEGFDRATIDLDEIAINVSPDQNQFVDFYLSSEEAQNDENPLLGMEYIIQGPLQTIFVRISNDFCEGFISFQVTVENCPFTIPNVLTPNDDNIQDRFTVIGLRDVYPEFKMQIFNRYGTKIWEGGNDDPDWDGRATMGPLAGDGRLPSATYFYVLETRGTDNQVYSGYVHLLY